MPINGHAQNMLNAGKKKSCFSFIKSLSCNSIEICLETNNLFFFFEKIVEIIKIEICKLFHVVNFYFCIKFKQVEIMVLFA